MRPRWGGAGGESRFVFSFGRFRSLALLGRGGAAGGAGAAAGLEVEEFAQGAVEGFFERAFVAGDAVDDGGVEGGRGRTGGGCGARGRVRDGLFALGVGGGIGEMVVVLHGEDALDEVGEFVVGVVGEEGDLAVEDAAHAPVGDEEAFEEEFLGDPDGRKLGVELGVEGGEFVGVLGGGAAGDAQEFGVDAVREGVEADGGLALGGDGAARATAVGGAGEGAAVGGGGLVGHGVPPGYGRDGPVRAAWGRRGRGGVKGLYLSDPSKGANRATLGKIGLNDATGLLPTAVRTV